jgi:hypothetical protein
MSARAGNLAKRLEWAAKNNLCKLCDQKSLCNQTDMFVVSCWKFEAPQCERCKLEHPERACDPPSCLGEEVAP